MTLLHDNDRPRPRGRRAHDAAPPRCGGRRLRARRRGRTSSGAATPWARCSALSAPIHEVRNRRSAARAPGSAEHGGGRRRAARRGGRRGRRPPRGRGRRTRPSTESISLISPGDPSFDGGRWPRLSGPPASATRCRSTTAYLAAMGVPVDAVAPPVGGRPPLERPTPPRSSSGRCRAGPPGGSSGTVYLRSSSIGGAAPTWTVVGSATSDVALADVRYDGDELSFTVARTSAEAEQLAVGVWVDGQPVSLGGDAVAQAGAGGRLARRAGRPRGSGRRGRTR